MAITTLIANHCLASSDFLLFDGSPNFARKRPYEASVNKASTINVLPSSDASFVATNACSWCNHARCGPAVGMRSRMTRLPVLDNTPASIASAKLAKPAPVLADTRIMFESDDGTLSTPSFVTSILFPTSTIELSSFSGSLRVDKVCNTSERW